MKVSAQVSDVSLLRVSAEDERPSPPLTWARRPVVVLLGGPRHRWWYFLDDARQLRSRALACQDWNYQDTGETADHPDYDVTGAVWRWASGAAS